jgi:nitrous oxidase accessory protein NosD
MTDPVGPAPKTGVNPAVPVIAGLVVLGYVASYAPTALQAGRKALDAGPGRELAERIAKATAGDTLTIAPGKYLFPRTVAITKPLTLVGAGPGATQLLTAGDGYTLTLNAQGIVLKALSVMKAPRSMGNVIELGSGEARLENCHVGLGRRSTGSFSVGWAGCGLVGDRGTSLELEKVLFFENASNALTTHGAVSFKDVTIRGSGDAAIELSDGAKATATGLHLEGNRDGIKVESASLELTESTIETSGTAVWLRRSQASLRHNQLQANHVGLTAEMGSSAVVEDNRITSNQAGAVQIDPRGPSPGGPSRVVAKNNRLAGNGGAKTSAEP